MKKVIATMLAAAMAMSMLTGCGCTVQDSDMTTMPSAEPTILPTNIPETTVPMESETEFMTIPATDATDASEFGETDGMNGDTQESTDETGTAPRSRMR